MHRHFLMLVIFSLLAVFFTTQLHFVVTSLWHLYTVILHIFDQLLNGFHYGHLIAQAIVLILLPLIICLLPAFIYWLITRRHISYFFILSWSIWLILVTILVWRH